MFEETTGQYQTNPFGYPSPTQMNNFQQAGQPLSQSASANHNPTVQLNNPHSSPGLIPPPGRPYQSTVSFGGVNGSGGDDTLNQTTSLDIKTEEKSKWTLKIDEI